MSHSRRKLAVFDFDGTLTAKDSFMDFMEYFTGERLFARRMFSLIPVSFRYAFGTIDNRELKVQYLTRFLKGVRKECFDERAVVYSVDRLPGLILHDALKRIEWHKERSHDIVIVSGSIREWLEPWCRQSGIILVANELEVVQGIITGNLAGSNCHGSGKVALLKRQFNLEEYDYIFAYGNSRADKEILNLADEPYFRPFRR